MTRISLTRRFTGLALTASLLALAACHRGEPTSGAATLRVPDGTPVILISVDTLRSDHLPMYGYQGVETPALDALRHDSILYRYAYSHVPLTLPSHTSMLTGLWPDEHGVRGNVGYHLDAAKHPWLPRILKQHGYTTGGAVSAFVLRAATGIGADFDFYDDHIAQRTWQLGTAQRKGDQTLAAVEPWLRKVHGSPFFLFFHLYEPHRPWNAPEPFASRYPLGYDAEIASADALVGRLVDELKHLGVYDRAIVFFVSDHGEGLGDHGYQEHGPLLYRDAIEVPMLLKLPGGERGGTTESTPAQLTDLMPTVLGLLGIDPPKGLAGLSLLALDGPGGQRPIFSETQFPRIHFGWSELTSVIEYPYHLIQGPSPELFNLETDPGEEHNIIQQDRRTYAKLRDALKGYDGSFQLPDQAEDPEVRRQLEALGYVGSVVDRSSESLADPKSKLRILNLLGKGLDLAEAGKFEDAVTAYRTVVEQEPQLVDAWEYLGNSLLRLGRPQEALKAFDHQMKLTGGSPSACLNMAGCLMRLGRLDEAKHFALIAGKEYDQANDLLAQIALKQGDLSSAQTYVDRALVHSQDAPSVRITQADLLLHQGHPEQALELTRKIEKLVEQERYDPQFVRGLYFIQGESLAQLGKGEEAVKAFNREIELFPRELAAYTRLAVVYALSGQPRQVAASLRRLVETNETPAAYIEAARTLKVLGDPASAQRLLEAARRRWPDAPGLRENPG